MTDLNSVRLRGRLASPPELKEFESGTRMWRLLLTVRSEEPHRRVDVIPVTVWSPPPETDLQLGVLEQGACVMIRGAIQRRFWEAPDGRRSRMEVVASTVMVVVSEREEQSSGT
jgi:single-stranded DNA-binding protein